MKSREVKETKQSYFVIFSRFLDFLTDFSMISSPFLEGTKWLLLWQVVTSIGLKNLNFEFLKSQNGRTNEGGENPQESLFQVDLKGLSDW